MRSGRVCTRPSQYGNGVTGLNAVPSFDQQTLVVLVNGDPVSRVLDVDDVTAVGSVGGEHDCAVVHRVDHRTNRRYKIHSEVADSRVEFG